MYDYDAAKTAWRELNQREPDRIPIYMKDWYWDAVCDNPEDWRVICIWKEDKVEAAFPFLYTKRKGMWFIELPWQVSCAGIWYRNIDMKNKEIELKYLNNMVCKIIEHLPKYDCFHMVFNHFLWTWHPFYWQGFQATPFYTQLIRNRELDEIKSKAAKDRRWRINRGERQFKIELNQMTVEEYWEFFEKSYDERNRTISYSKAKFVKLLTELIERNACEIRGVYDENHIQVAENILLKDAERVYNQFGTQLKKYDNATTLAVYDGIKECIVQGKIFDFEGSMIPGVCEFNSSWNPEFELNYCISKYSYKYVFLDSIRKIFRR